MSLTVNVFGGTASMCTDFGTSPVGGTCHLPLQKMVWGDDNLSYKVNETYPLPVQIMEVTGESLVVSGNLGASGSFPIVNPFVSGTTGPIQFIAVGGSTSGAPVGITGSVRLYEDIGVTGTVKTRNLTAATDTVAVTGDVRIKGGLSLTSGTDSIKVFGSDGGVRVPSALYAANGTTLGVSGDALKVAITNSGITFSAVIASTVGVTNANWSPTINEAGALRTQGVSGGYPLTVQGLNGNAIEVTTQPTDSLSVTGDYFTDGTQKTKVSEIMRSSTFLAGSTLINGVTAHQLLGSNSIKTGVRVKSHPSNTDLIYVGEGVLAGHQSAGSGLPTDFAKTLISGSTLNAYPLESGESIFIECNNTNLIFIRNGVRGLTGIINYVAT
tara:strand:+ start:771 stop:1922 length:1152 start_codon:yes stop_codon:yes gene_type:complete